MAYENHGRALIADGRLTFRIADLTGGTADMVMASLEVASVQQVDMGVNLSPNDYYNTMMPWGKE